jgi:hypothetical protein
MITIIVHARPIHQTVGAPEMKQQELWIDLERMIMYCLLMLLWCFLYCSVWRTTRDWDQLTAVIAAASAGHMDMVKFLADSGADVNAKDKVGSVDNLYIGSSLRHLFALGKAGPAGFVEIYDQMVQSSACHHGVTLSGVLK